jgi:N-acetylmuramoyl-L-alanine amidase
VPLTRNLLWTAAAALVAAGCATHQVQELPLTEVTLPEAKPFVLPPVLLGTNVAVATNRMTVPAPAPAATNLAHNHIPPPVNHGWVCLRNWSQACDLGQPQTLASEAYAVATPHGKAVFQAGSQCLRWEGVNVWLGFAPRYLQGQPNVHSLDVAKTLEPLLRASPAPALPGRVIVLDPGHGGSDGGTGPNKQTLEKTFALDWALRVKALLQTNGWQVHLTRSNDVDVSLAERVALADRVGAHLFISLHFNGLAADARHGGVETFCTTPLGLPSSVKRNGEDSAAVEFPNNRFDAENLQYAFRLHRELLSNTQAMDGGVRRARFIAVLRAQHRPAVLIEGGFLSNPDEARRISTAAYRQKLAGAVAHAIDQLPVRD